MSDVTDVYRLTPLQAGVLLHSLAEPDSGIYVVQMRYELTGCVDVGFLREAWQSVMDRHAVLRTAIAWQDLPAPVQVVLANCDVELVQTDLRDVPAAEQASRLEDVLSRDRSDGFDLSVAPLMRVLLVALGDEQHELIWTHHHVILDGWSAAVVSDEVFDAYRRLTSGSPLTANPVQMTFHDHVRWLSERQTSGSSGFWQRELSGYRLPAAIDSGLLGERRNESRWFDRRLEITPERFQAWTAAARRYGVSLSTLIHASWAVVVGRLDESSPAEVVIGTVVAVRDFERPGGDQVVGLCINTLPLRVPFVPDGPVDSWLRSIAVRLAAIREHDATDLSDVQRSSEVPVGEPVFRYILAVENYAQGVLGTTSDVGGLLVRYLGVSESTNYAITAGMPAGREPHLKVTLDSRTFDRTGADDMLMAWRDTLDELASGPPSVGHLLMVPRRRSDDGIGSATTVVTSTSTLDQSFADSVAKHPDAPAVTFGDLTWTYGEIDSKATRTAARLVAMGVGAGTTVGLVADRSPSLVVAIIAILRSGAAYVALDPGHPASRRRLLVEDLGVRVVVTDIERDLPELDDCRVLRLDEVDAEETDAPRNPGADSATPHTGRDPAYVIYTSGSTGRPKGVLVPHENVLALVASTSSHGDFGPSDVWSMFHSYAFDVSVFEMWGALLTGGHLVVVPAETARSPDDLHALVRAAGVTVLSQTPSAFATFVAADRHAGGVGDSLRLVLLAGEDVGSINLQPWFDRYGDRRPRIVNLYGITETTVHTTWHEMRTRDLATSTGASRIGSALPGWSLRLLDAGLRPVADHEVGELFVGGSGVAWGYANRPGLTAERFVPDPGGSGGRVYRSGDRARRRPDGTFEFVGRADAQVKIRGVRVEPGEIEAVIKESPAVQQCIVMAKEVGPGDLRLIAYVVLAEDQRHSVSSDDLRQLTRERLPESMQPSNWVLLQDLPSTTSGKVDRAALAEVSVPVDQRAGVAPETRTERVVAAAWCVVLGLPFVTASANFFDLGGNSLLLFALLQQLQTTWPELRMVELFAHPTVASLAAELDRSKEDDLVRSRDEAGDVPHSPDRRRLAALRDRRTRGRS